MRQVGCTSRCWSGGTRSPSPALGSSSGSFLSFTCTITAVNRHRDTQSGTGLQPTNEPMMVTSHMTWHSPTHCEIRVEDGSTGKGWQPWDPTYMWVHRQSRVGIHPPWSCRAAIALHHLLSPAQKGTQPLQGGGVCIRQTPGVQLPPPPKLPHCCLNPCRAATPVMRSPAEFQSWALAQKSDVPSCQWQV